MGIKMNDSLDLRNRILKMRESNNLNVTKQDSLNNNLMSEFESSIKDGNTKETKSDKPTISNSSQNKSENLIQHNVKTENQDIIRNVNDNDAQFLMLANKFNEAVEVILELSDKVEKLEKNTSQDKNMQKNKVNTSSFFNLKILVFILLVPILFIVFFTLPFDFLLIKTIIIDILSSL